MSNQLSESRPTVERRPKNPTKRSEVEILRKQQAFPVIWYNTVFESMKTEFGTTWYASISPWQWRMWRRHMKTMFFERGIAFTEMIAGLAEAGGKERWPMGRGFFSRLQDVCYKNRRERPKISEVNTGLQSMGALLTKNRF